MSNAAHPLASVLADLFFGDVISNLYTNGLHPADVCDSGHAAALRSVMDAGLVFVTKDYRLDLTTEGARLLGASS